MSNVSMFFAGVGTTALLLGAGFGGGLMLAKTAMEPASQTRATAADRLPPARVVLPASIETASVPSEPLPSAPSAPQQQVPSQIPAKELWVEPTELDRRSNRAEQKKAVAEDRERRRRYAERKARRQVERAKPRQDQAPRQEQPGIMAFGTNDEPRLGGFFGN